MDLDIFLDRWAASGEAKRANYEQFLSALCRVLGVPEQKPTRPDNAQNAHVLKRTVFGAQDDGASTPRRIDLYRRGSFILEAKQGVEKEVAAEEEIRERTSHFYLYGITQNDIKYIMDTFPIVKRKDEVQCSTYRTKNAILKIYNEITRVGVDSYRTRLEPGPDDERAAHGVGMEA